MNKEYTYIYMVLDESGSMSTRRADVIGSVNSFIKKHKEIPGKADITIRTFNDKHNIILNNKDLYSTGDLHENSYYPMGSTALYDAIGLGIDTLGGILREKNPKDRPDKVIFIIQTDGEENSSVVYKLQDIKEKIQHQTSKYNWEFVFVGVTSESVLNAQDMGIPKDNTMAYINSSKGTQQTFDSLASNSVCYRSSGVASMAFTQKDRDAQTDSTVPGEIQSNSPNIISNINKLFEINQIVP
jgi:hypothetical protein